MTARRMEGDRERCLAAGMDDYLAKPVKLGELKQALERWVGAAGHEHHSEPRAANALGPFDPEVVAVLRSLTPAGQQDSFVSLAQLFMTSATGLLETLRTAIAREDAAAVARVAHTLKGSAANLGAAPLADACLQLEEALPAGLGGTRPTVARVEEEFARVREWLAAEAS